MKNIDYWKNMIGDNFEKIKRFEIISDLLSYDLKEFPNDIAVSWKENQKSYQELIEDIGKTRKLFIDNNITKGSNVAMVFNNNYNFVKTFFAITTLGAVAVILPPALPCEALLGSFKKFNSSIIVYGQEAEEKIDKIKSENSDFTFISYKDFDSLEGSASEIEDISPNDPAAIMMTGGTTGPSKGAILSHRALLRGAYNGSLVEGQIFKNTYMVLIPFFHVFGMVRNLLTSMNTGSNVYLLENNMSLFDEIREVKPNIMVLVPALCDLIYATVSQYGKEAVGGNLEYIIAGGAFVTPETITNLLKFDIKCCPGYGLTETANLVCGSVNYRDKPNSVGIVYPEQEVKIVNDEIWVKGDNLFDGYFNDDQETKNSLTEDGYFKTGDLGKFDEENFLYITGRSKNIIVLENGENVSPEVIENELDNVPIINSSLVYEGKSSNGRGIIVAKIFPNFPVLQNLQIDDVEKSIQEEVDKVNDKFPKFMQINKVIVLKEDFLRSGSMKIIREKNKD